jgi:hypothetical protein
MVNNRYQVPWNEMERVVTNMVEFEFKIEFEFELEFVFG